MSWTNAQIKDKLMRIEAKIDELLTLEKGAEQPKPETMTASERMAHARSFKKDVNTGEEGRG